MSSSHSTSPITTSIESAIVRPPSATFAKGISTSLLMASGHPRSRAFLSDLGHTVVPLDVTEFRKMDGGLSCLSLRIIF